MTLTTLANLALSKIGQTIIPSLDDPNSKSARLAKLHLVPCLQEVLRAHFWNFALTTRDLVALDRRADFSNSQFSLKAVDTGSTGNNLSLAITGGEVIHSLYEDNGAITFVQGTHSRLTITGDTTPPTASTLYRVLAPASVTFPGKHQWSTNAASAAPTTGDWMDIYQGYMVNGITATLEELAPTAGYTANVNKTIASQIHVLNPDFSGSILAYWLLQPIDSSPPYWVLSGDGTYANRNLEMIAAGKLLYVLRSPGNGFINGTLGPMQNDPETHWVFVLRSFTDGALTGTWLGNGTSPETSTWGNTNLGTGIPEVSATGLRATLGEMQTLMASVSELVTLTLIGKPTDYVQNMERQHLAGGVDDASISGWTYAYLLPADCMKIKTLRPAGSGKDSKIDKFAIRRVAGHACILCNVDGVSLEFVEYVDDPAFFDPLFTTAFVTLLASKLARAISGSDDLEAKFLQIYESINLPAARTGASQETDSNENHPLREFLNGSLTPGRGDFFGGQPVFHEDEPTVVITGGNNTVSDWSGEIT